MIKLIDPADYLFRHLTDDGLVGDGTNWEMAVDGTTPTEFFIASDDIHDYFITEVEFMIQDGGTWRPDNFAGLGSPLANGFLLSIKDKDNNVLLDLLDGDPVVSIIQLEENLDSVTEAPFDGGSADSAILGVWDMLKDLAGNPMWLSAGNKLCLTIRDDLTSVTSMQVHVRGYRAPPVPYDTGA